MELLDVVVLKKTERRQGKITKKDFEEILNNKDFYLTQKGEVCFGDNDELATLYIFNYKNKCRVLIWNDKEAIK